MKKCCYAFVKPYNHIKMSKTNLGRYYICLLFIIFRHNKFSSGEKFMAAKSLFTKVSPSKGQLKLSVNFSTLEFPWIHLNTASFLVYGLNTVIY